MKLLLQAHKDAQESRGADGCQQQPWFSSAFIALYHVCNKLLLLVLVCGVCVWICDSVHGGMSVPAFQPGKLEKVIECIIGKLTRGGVSNKKYLSYYSILEFL